jgi:hypothetical protein
VKYKAFFICLLLAGVAGAQTYLFTPSISKRKVKVVRKYEVMALAGQTSVVEIPAMFGFAGATNEQVIESSAFTFSILPDEKSIVCHELGMPRKMYRFVWKNPAAIGITITQEMAITLTARNKLCTQAKLPYSVQIHDKFKYYLEKSKDGDISPDHPAIASICTGILQGSRYAEEAVSGVCDWINDNIEFVSQTNYGSDKALESKQGNCTSMSYLACAMLRKMGIPCDTVSAKFIESDKGHGFIEVYFPDAGWVFYDLSNWERGFKSLDCLPTAGWAYRIQLDPKRKFDWVDGYFSKERDMTKYQEPQAVTKKAIRAEPRKADVRSVMVSHTPVPAGLSIRQEPLRNMTLDPNTLPPEIK